ncbi:hypothetical protein A7985_00775 [Pseudoalteromonas luteoviolacea]|uniref:Uncharacterized protein n=1 Tax=Pseudoalteromonas luteoviolacea TaxID=43657 RepID=A0A1C0TT86_9GAMM|nr:hypothetical protein [Pseudoalteromonas luteoviolacea]OCQ22532.1 hypothetical protein A7985_00775 [Pseudoalteromonas luteoviolacea]
MVVDATNFYFQSYEQWRHAITVKCNIKLTPEYARSRIASLSDSNERHTKEFADKYGEAYLMQVIEWFARAEQES